MRLAIATWDKHPLLYDEEGTLPALLRPLGVEAAAVVWSDPSIDWSAFDAVLLRSTWDYFERLSAFLAWLERLERLGVRLVNAPGLVRWNLDKRYLGDLAARGGSVAPTRFVAADEPATLAAVLAERGWSEVVVKPAVSASAYRTRRIGPRTPPAEAELALAEAKASGAALVQPFLSEIASEGEWSLLFFGGVFSHAVLKTPAAGDFRVQPQFGAGFQALAPPPEVLEEAARTLALAPSPPVYARVDGVRSGGRFLLMELELIEPYLYAAQSPGALRRYAQAVAQALVRTAAPL